MLLSQKPASTSTTAVSQGKSSPKKKQEEEADSDEEAFMKKEENKNNDEEGEELSELSADSAKDDAEAKDFLYAQYEKVHRVKNKWKCTFKDAVLQINGREYIFDRVNGELERDW